MKNARRLTGWAFALAAIVWPLAASAQEDVAVVEVTGSGENRDAAINDALRKAVQAGAGVEVASRTETLDHSVAMDRIVTRSSGYIAKYQVLGEEKKFDIWRVKIQAEVNKGKIKSDWAEIQLILEKKGRPSVVVLIQETVFDPAGKAQEAMTEYASSSIETLLLDKGFSLKSSKGLDEIEKRNRDAAIAENNLDALAAISKRFGANVMIVGKSTCRKTGSSTAHEGVKIEHFLATASITAYNSDTGDLILSLAMEGKGSALGDAAAITMAFKRVSENVSDAVLRKILEKWYFEFQHGAAVQIELTVKAESAKGLRQAGKMAIRFQEAMKEIEGVKDARMGPFSKGTDSAAVTITVDTTLNADELRNKMMLLETAELGFSLEWTGSDKNTLRFVLYVEE